MMLNKDIARCSNERCKKKLKCKRYLDCLPWETYSYSDFNEVDCKNFIENEDEKRWHLTRTYTTDIKK